MDRADLATIAWDARSLTERLAAAPAPAGEPAGDPDAAAGRLRRYRDVAGRGNPDTFARRLSWDGLDLTAVRRVLADPPPDATADVPGWGATLAAVVAATRAAAPADPPPGSARPFAAVWLPAVAVARERLDRELARTPDRPVPVGGPALADLARGLLAHLCEISARTLYAEFDRERPLGLRLLGGLRADGGEPVPTGRYDAFVARLRADGLRSLFLAYPVLARLVATGIDDWVDAQREFLGRLAADLPALRARLGVPAGAEVAGLEVGLSDRHRGGRTVVVVRFEGGAKVVHKPRDLAVEVAFNRFVGWCDAQLGDEHALRTLTVLARDGYGWAEHVEHLPVPDAAAAARYHRRAGRLLCLLYALGATDCHLGNLIAAGDQPVLVDLEALVYHELSWFEVPEDERAVLSADLDQLWDSVLRTGMLPAWQFGRDKRVAHDLSGLGGGGAGGAGRVVGQQWRFPDTDQMVSVRAAQPVAPDRNAVLLDGRPVPADEHVEAIVTGFQEMYDLLVDRRDALLAPDGPLAAFADLPVRFIFRDTSTYGLVLEHSLEPRFLRSGLDRGIELEFLGRALLHSPDRPLEWPVVAAEIEALDRLDIPHFQTSTSSSDLPLGPGPVVAGLFDRPSYDRTRRRIAALGPADRELQSGMIRGSFHARLAHLASGAADEAGPVPAGVPAGPALDPDRAVRVAGDIARELDHRSIELARHGVSWMHLNYLLHTQRFVHQPVNASLYEGVGGIALFLAAYGLVADDRRATALALRSLESFRRLLRAHRSQAGRGGPVALGLGAGIGLGSIVWALTTVGGLVGDDSLVEDAAGISRLLTPDLVRDDVALDVLSGSAGAIVGLLRLHQVTGDAELLERAVWCADRLLASRVRVGDGTAAWASPGEALPLGGLAHGPSGMALALARLHREVGDPAYLTAAAEGLAYERTLYDDGLAGWRDLREGPDGDRTPRAARGWCSGAAGYGLGHLALARVAPGIVDRTDLDRALRPAPEGPLARLDSYCCGNAGRVELLLVAARDLGRPELADEAWQLAELAVVRARAAGGYEFIPGVPRSVFSPGLFRGSCGVGYQLLRLAHPDVLPSVLTWD